LEPVSKGNLLPVDELLPALYDDDVREKLKQLFGATRLHAYAARQKLIEQDDKQHMGSDTEATELFIHTQP